MQPISSQSILSELALSRLGQRPFAKSFQPATVRFGENSENLDTHVLMGLARQLEPITLNNHNGNSLNLLEVLFVLYQNKEGYDGKPGFINASRGKEEYPSAYLMLLKEQLGFERIEQAEEALRSLLDRGLLCAEQPSGILGLSSRLRGKVSLEKARLTSKAEKIIESYYIPKVLDAYMLLGRLKCTGKRYKSFKINLTPLELLTQMQRVAQADGKVHLSFEFSERTGCAYSELQKAMVDFQVMGLVTYCDFQNYQLTSLGQALVQMYDNSFRRGNASATPTSDGLMDSATALRFVAEFRRLEQTRTEGAGQPASHPIPYVPPVSTQATTVAKGQAAVSQALPLHKISPQEALQTLKISGRLPEEAVHVIEEAIATSQRGDDKSTEVAAAKRWLSKIFSYPWLAETEDQSDTVAAHEIFSKNLYGLTDVEERLLDEIAARGYGGGNKGGVIVLLGAPGVGKTVCVKTLAKMLGRKFARMSVAGVDDASALRGHIPTYISAEPGKFHVAMVQAGTRNPVIQIDELDKMNKKPGSSPENVLYEALDPEQNHAFQNEFYKGVPMDLSKVLFVLTANSLDDVPPALRDRMEVIEVRGYLPEEKIEIALHNLVPEYLGELNVSPEKIQLPRETLAHIVANYVRDAGMRSTKRLVQTLIRKACRRLRENLTLQSLTITPEMADQFLAQNKVQRSVKDPQSDRPVGEVGGLFFSPQTGGGGILPVQASTSKGTGELLLTGSLGEVMQEAAKVAMTFLKSNADKIPGVKSAETASVEAKPDHQSDKISDFLEGKSDLHIHYPDGAVQKDGPSAGITTAVAIWSQLTGIPVKSGVTMTGEIDLMGRVKGIGGVLEKCCGAMLEGAKTVFLPEENRETFNQLVSTSEIFRRMIEEKGLKTVFVSNVIELLQTLAQGQTEGNDTGMSEPRL